MENNENLKLKFIEITNFSVNNIPLKPEKIELNFEKDNHIIIITGNNGVGKTSFINLIFGILEGKKEIYSKVRYEKIVFKFDNDECIKLKGNLKFTTINKSFNEKTNIYNSKTNTYNYIATYSYNFERIIENFLLIKKWSWLMAKSEMTEKIIKLTRETLIEENLNELIKDIKKNLDSIGIKEEFKFIKISELTSVINVTDINPKIFFNKILTNISQQINIINTSMLKNTPEEEEKINKINKIFTNKVEYFSSFRNVKDFLKNQKNYSSLENDLNEENKEIISVELNKLNLRKSVLELSEKTKDKINKLKSDFFEIIAKNQWENDPSLQYNDLIQFSEDIKDENLIKLTRNLKKEKLFRERIEGFIKPFVNTIKEVSKFTSRINSFISKINKCFLNKKIVYKENDLFIETKNGKDLEFTEDKLSSGEKQIFLLLQTVWLSDKEIIIIDEPENSLSIKWQRILRDSFDAVQKKKKFIIISHSPYMIRKEDIEKKEERIIYFKNE